MVSKPLLIWDGDCGFCARSVKFLRKTSRRDFDDSPSQRLSPELREKVDAKRTRSEIVLLFPDGNLVGGADAPFWLLRDSKLRGLVTLASLPGVILFSRSIYRLIARNRGRINQIFFRGAACSIEDSRPSTPRK